MTTNLISINNDNNNVTISWSEETKQLVASNGDILDIPYTITDIDAAYDYLCAAYADRAWDMQDLYA